MAKLFVKDYEYRHAKGSVSSLNYHFVFCPKRRKAVLIDGVARRLQEIIFVVWAMPTLLSLPSILV